MMSTEHSLSAGFGSPAAAPAASRGRGAVTNVRHRFEQTEREAFDDGWFGGDPDAPSPVDLSLDDIQDEPRRPPVADEQEGGEAAGHSIISAAGALSGVSPGTSPETVGLPPAATQRYIPVVAAPRTTVKPEQARKLLSRNDSPDIPFDVAVNPYRGCEHGCVYCYARPTHATWAIRRAWISRPGWSPRPMRSRRCGPSWRGRATRCRPSISARPPMSTSIERTWRLTRGLLELMVETGHPLTLVTKNSLVERDLDLLTTLARERLVTVFISITTLDADMARTLEPRASAPWRRVETVRKLAEAGVPVGVLVAPVIPFINDESMEQILEAAAGAGACSASYTVVRLPWEVKEVFETWLHTHFPDRAQRVLHRIEDMRGGKRNDSSFDTRMRGTGIWPICCGSAFRWPPAIWA